MTRAKFDANEFRERLFMMANYRCKVCGKWLRGGGTPQLAHRIPSTKANIRKYGKDVIHHEKNLVPVCSLRCNASVLLDNRPTERDALIATILEALGYGID